MDDPYEAYLKHCDKRRLPALPREEFEQRYWKRFEKGGRSWVAQFLAAYVPHSDEVDSAYEEYTTWVKARGSWPMRCPDFARLLSEHRRRVGVESFELYLKTRIPMHSEPSDPYEDYRAYCAKTGIWPLPKEDFESRLRRKQDTATMAAIHQCQRFLREAEPPAPEDAYQTYVAWCEKQRYYILDVRGYQEVVFVFTHPVVLRCKRRPGDWKTIECQWCKGKGIDPAGRRDVYGTARIPGFSGETYYLPLDGPARCATCNGTGIVRLPVWRDTSEWVKNEINTFCVKAPVNFFTKAP